MQIWDVDSMDLSILDLLELEQRAKLWFLMDAKHLWLSELLILSLIFTLYWFCFSFFSLNVNFILTIYILYFKLAEFVDFVIVLETSVVGYGFNADSWFSVLTCWFLVFHCDILYMKIISDSSHYCFWIQLICFMKTWF